MDCLFVSDLHGKEDRYKILREVIIANEPEAVFIGGDLLPMQFAENFIKSKFFPLVERFKKTKFFVIMGNDDPRKYEYLFQRTKAVEYVHDRTVGFGDLFVTGYSYVPPTPFHLKDWERYDVSRFLDVGDVSPERGVRTIDVESQDTKHSTIEDDLRKLVKNSPSKKTIYLFHAPPYGGKLDKTDREGVEVDRAPVDVHVGSIAIKRFIKREQPLLTLHGHIHESPRLTGSWCERDGSTYSFSAAHDGPGLSVVFFDPFNLKKATRELII